MVEVQQKSRKAKATTKLETINKTNNTKSNKRQEIVAYQQAQFTRTNTWI